MHRLFTIPGSGGMIVEAAFALADVPLEVTVLEWKDLGWDSNALGPYNPLGQVPTLILPDQQVMTESAAMLLYLSELKPETGIAPAADDPDRPLFLRWLIFLVAAVYPTFTYGDVPQRWVLGDEAAADKLRRGTDDHRLTLYRTLEEESGEPWFLGERFSAIDLYPMVMRHWRPHTEWFEAQCPRLNRIGLEAARIPSVSKVLTKYFPDD